MKYIIFIPIIFFVVIILFFWKQMGTDPNTIPSPLINKPAPHFLATEFLSNNTITETAFQNKVTLLNVFATWCYSCAIEHQFLSTLQPSDQWQWIGLDYKDERAATKQWLQSSNNPYRFIIFDNKGQIAMDYGVYGTPETFIIDKKGIIRFKYTGDINERVWKTKFLPLLTILASE